MRFKTTILIATMMLLTVSLVSAQNNPFDNGWNNFAKTIKPIERCDFILPATQYREELVYKNAGIMWKGECIIPGNSHEQEQGSNDGGSSNTEEQPTCTVYEAGIKKELEDCECLDPYWERGQPKCHEWTNCGCHDWEVAEYAQSECSETPCTLTTHFECSLCKGPFGAEYNPQNGDCIKDDQGWFRNGRCVEKTRETNWVCGEKV